MRKFRLDAAYAAGILLAAVCAACGGADAEAAAGAEESDVTKLAGSLPAIKNPSSFALSSEGIYATAEGEIVRTDLQGKKATVVEGTSGATSVVALDDDRLLFTRRRSPAFAVFGVPTAGGKDAELGSSDKELVTSRAIAGSQLFYTWVDRGTGQGGLDVVTLDGSGASSQLVGKISEVKGSEPPVIVGDTVFVVDSSEWVKTHRMAKVIGFTRAGKSWSRRDVALVPGVFERGTLVNHGDSLYLVGSEGLHRIQRERAGTDVQKAPLLVSSEDCRSARTFAVDEGGIYLACMDDEGAAFEIYSYGLDGTRKKKLGRLHEDSGPEMPEVRAMSTTADAVYVLQDKEGPESAESRLYRFAKK